MIRLSEKKRLLGFFVIVNGVILFWNIGTLYSNCNPNQPFSIQSGWGCSSARWTVSYFERAINGKKRELFKQPSIDIGQVFRSRTRRVEGIECGALLREPPRDNSTSEQLSKFKVPSYLEVTKNCSEFINGRGYINDVLTKEEGQFPVAFSILVYKDVYQVERLLRSIYRPQNYYCIHVDNKSEAIFKKELTAIANCFPNVLLPPKPVNVTWGRFTVVEAEIICLNTLWKYKKWKYFINLTGQEFPLKTNFELVKILKAFNGANDARGLVYSPNWSRWIEAGPAPHHIRPMKGATHVVLSRGFVDYVLHNQTAKDLLAWANKTRFPDETYFPTLNHNPQLMIPGSYTGDPETYPSKPYTARFKIWGSGWCAGKTVHGVCVLGVGDLPKMAKAEQLFANKFHLDYQPITYDCLEEWNFNRTRDYYYGKLHFNDTYYRGLPFVKLKVPQGTSSK